MVLKPWLQPYGELSTDWMGREQGSVAAYLNHRAHAMSLDGAVCFEPSSESLGALAYEARCQQGCIPTRDLAHDWYNGVVWQALPNFKRALNAAHLEESARGNSPMQGNGRTAKRDALTLLDESGAVLLCSDPAMVRALIEHDWTTLFETHRSAWGTGAQLLVFGHGLMEALDHAHKGLCAKVLPVALQADGLRSLPASSAEVDADTLRCWDHLLVKALTWVEVPAQLSPLPVLGVPGWCAGNDDVGFYKDARVFRPKPTLQGNKSSQRLALRWDGSTLSS